MITFDNIIGFDWDKGNIDKNLIKHKVSSKGTEGLFKNTPLLINTDKKHSTKEEPRFLGLGKTDSGRKLFISFTLRKDKIRIISARVMSKRERKLYNEKEREKI